MQDTTPGSLTVKDFAEQAGLSEKAVRRRIERGTLPRVRGENGGIRVPAMALQGRGQLDQGVLGRLEEMALELGQLRAETDQVDSRGRALELQLREQRARAEAAEQRESQLIAYSEKQADRADARERRLQAELDAVRAELDQRRR